MPMHVFAPKATIGHQGAIPSRRLISMSSKKKNCALMCRSATAPQEKSSFSQG
jgi:hypothetical protein